jgi:predicted nucleic acid-binding protein
MRVAFDTSVGVAALIREHPFHLRARAWIDAVASSSIEGVVALHGLVETWSVLTKLPIVARLTLEQARALVAQARTKFEIFTPDAALYDEAIERRATRGLRSGVIFDALHLVSAERAKVDVLVTFNAADAVRLVAHPAVRIIVPPESPSIDV